MPTLDSRLRGNDKVGAFSSQFEYEQVCAARTTKLLAGLTLWMTRLALLVRNSSTNKYVLLVLPSYWQDSHSGLSIEQNLAVAVTLSRVSGFAVGVILTAFNSPP